MRSKYLKLILLTLVSIFAFLSSSQCDSGVVGRVVSAVMRSL